MNSNSLDKSKIKFLLLEGVHQSALDTLQAEGYTNIDYRTTSLPEDELKQAIANAHFVGVRSRTQLTKEVLQSAQNLCAIGCFCIGTNQVDLAAARELGVPVFNAPFSNTRSVAELVLAEAIILMRGVAAKSAMAHRGEWLKSASNSYEVRGKKLGIVGYGHIGSQAGILAESLGMQVLFYDIENKLALGNAKKRDTLEQLLGESDIITLHVPETPQTKNMFGPIQFDQMKDKSVFINAARGTVVDLGALRENLISGKLLGAAIDVFPVEPKSNSEEFVSELRGIDNIILTPHVGGSTQEAQVNIGIEVAEKLAKYSDNGSTLSCVNFPEVSLPIHKGSHRILHIHQNIPGILAEINNVFSENNINILGQYLQTFDNLGYVVIDLEQAQSKLALEKIQTVKGTLRCRVLH